MKRTGLLLVAVFCAATGVMAQTKGPRPEPQPASKQEWQKALSNKISRFLRVPKPIEGISGSYTAMIAFVVHKDGTITDVALKESSGVSQVDENALRAVSRVSPVAPFSSDMKEEPQKVTVPIKMTLELPLVITKDDVTGLTFTAPRMLEAVGKVEPPGSETVKYNIISTNAERIPNAPGSALCHIGFRERAKDDPQFGWAQEKLNEDAVFDPFASGMKSWLEQRGKIVDDFQMIDMQGARAVEMIIAPTSGPDYENVLQYAVFSDNPAGRITVSCATTRTAMKTARHTFIRLAQSINIAR